MRGDHPAVVHVPPGAPAKGPIARDIRASPVGFRVREGPSIATTSTVLHVRAASRDRCTLTRMATSGDWFFFDETERDVIRQALGVLTPKHRDEVAGMLDRLGSHAALIRDTPPIATSWDAVTNRRFSVESLLEKLCDVKEYDIDLHIPTKAVVGQAFLVAKINTLKALGYILAHEAAHEEVAARVAHEAAQSIYTKLAEELFIAIVTDRDELRDVKMTAARFLHRIWEERLLVEIDDFAPLLESAWSARSKLLPVLGTMLGTHEVFRLFREARDKRFLDYFAEDAPAEQVLAFEEFLFDLSHEEISRIRTSMESEGKRVISRADAFTLLGQAEPRPDEETGASALYTSYKKRRVNAIHRSLSGSAGPKKTAEEYVMLAFLRSGTSLRMSQ